MTLWNRFARDLREHPSRWILVLLCLFMFFPGLDLGLSGLFYDRGAGFARDGGGPLEFVRAAVPVIILGNFLFCLILWIAGIFFDQWFWGMTPPRAVYLMTTLLVGPGLFVETLLKPNWGRARPKDLVLFGGDAAYTPPLWMAQECAQNCAFVSGHAALGFWLSAYGFIMPPQWRWRGIVVGLTCGAGVGLVRIAQGAHFLSDVVFAGAIVLVVNYALAKVIVHRPAKPGLL